MKTHPRRSYSLCRFLLSIFALLLISLPPASVYGQTNLGSLTVSLVDGANQTPINGATVTATRTDTGQTRIKKTAIDGNAFFVNLEPATYELVVTHPDYVERALGNVNINFEG